jgi:hypothetical protein
MGIDISYCKDNFVLSNGRYEFVFTAEAIEAIHQYSLKAQGK